MTRDRQRLTEGAIALVLFGLTTISFAKHPEGLVENGKHKAHARLERLKARRDAHRGQQREAVAGEVAT